MDKPGNKYGPIVYAQRPSRNINIFMALRPKRSNPRLCECSLAAFLNVPPPKNGGKKEGQGFRDSRSGDLRCEKQWVTPSLYYIYKLEGNPCQNLTGLKDLPDHPPTLESLDLLPPQPLPPPVHVRFILHF